MKATLFSISIFLLSFSLSAQKYAVSKQKVRQKKGKLLTWYNKQPNKEQAFDSIQQVFTHELVNTIIPHWYGTKWDFNGYTATPKVGVIACGYFVSTTLLHMGVTINRYRMAQQSALSEIKTIQKENKPLHYIQQDDTLGYKNLLKQLKKDLKEGLYMVGLDNHVGYLYKENGHIYFIHSNYMDPVAVVKENVINSPAFANSYHYYIGNITHNNQFIMKWLKNERISIVYD